MIEVVKQGGNMSSNYHIEFIHPWGDDYKRDYNPEISFRYDDTSMEYHHGHRKEEGIQELVLDILNTQQAEEAQIQIQTIHDKVLNCHNHLEEALNQIPFQIAKPALKQQINKDKAILNYLEEALIKCFIANVKQPLEEQQHKKKKHHNCVLI